MVKRKNLKQEPSEDPLPQDSSDEEESARKKVRWNAGTDGSTEQDSDNDSQATKKVAYFVLDLTCRACPYTGRGVDHYGCILFSWKLRLRVL